MKRPPRDVSTSVKQRLLNKARETGRPFNELLQYFGMERFLYRLSRSAHAKRFVVKGAVMLVAWRVPAWRPTKDIDLLGKVRNELAGITEILKEICSVETEPDGLVFHPESVVAEPITVDAEYEGVRVELVGTLGTARVGLQVDIGFGDAVVPGSVDFEYPTILGHPAPHLRGYTRESSIAEKFHAMVRRGELNSRMKDFFDVWALSRNYGFDGSLLASAIVETFRRRNTAIPVAPIAFTDAFAEHPDKATQWRAFRRKGRLDAAPQDFLEVVGAVRFFLGPMAHSLGGEGVFGLRWTPPGPWGPRT